MVSALAQQPGGKPVARRVRWLHRIAVCLAIVALAVGTVWFTPWRNVHLLPNRSNEPHAIAPAPAEPQPPDNAAPRADVKNSPEASLPALQAADREQATVSHGTSDGKAVAPVAVAPADAPPVLLVGRIVDGTQSPRSTTEFASRLTGTLDGVALRAPAVPTNATSENAAPPIPTAAAASPPIDGVPMPRPPLPLETDLIAGGAPDADTAAQSGAAAPAPPTPPGKPAATDRRG